MLTACGICGCALVVPQGEDASAFCRECFRHNFSGQMIPDVDPPRVQVLGLGPPVVGRRVVPRPRQESNDAPHGV